MHSQNDPDLSGNFLRQEKCSDPNASKLSSNHLIIKNFYKQENGFDFQDSCKIKDFTLGKNDHQIKLLKNDQEIAPL
jgi:hypothetical protein